MKQECSQGTQGHGKSIFKYNISFGQNQSIGGTFSVDLLLHLFLYRNSTEVAKVWLLNNLSHIVALGGFKCNNKSLALWRHIPQHEKRGMDLICKSLFCFTCAKIPHKKVVPSWYLRKEVNREVRSFDFE